MEHAELYVQHTYVYNYYAYDEQIYFSASYCKIGELLSACSYIGVLPGG